MKFWLWHSIHTPCIRPIFSSHAGRLELIGAKRYHDRRSPTSWGACCCAKTADMADGTGGCWEVFNRKLPWLSFPIPLITHGVVSNAVGKTPCRSRIAGDPGRYGSSCRFQPLRTCSNENSWRRWHIWHWPTDPSSAGFPILWQALQVNSVRSSPSSSAIALRDLSGAYPPSGICSYKAIRSWLSPSVPSTATYAGRP